MWLSVFNEAEIATKYFWGKKIYSLKDYIYFLNWWCRYKWDFKLKVPNKNLNISINFKYSDIMIEILWRKPKWHETLWEKFLVQWK